jgi:CheY-like chemotaxis protein/tetratricopeptide (TPR) repeat protein
MTTPTILCAAADENLFQLHEKALGGLGYRVIAADDGEKALSMIRQQSPDLVLLDIQLPGMNGFDVLEEIRDDEKRLGKIPVILQSTREPTARMRARAKVLSATVVSMPIPLNRLLAKVKKVVKPGPPHANPDWSGAQPPISGSFAQIDFAGLIQQLHASRASGVLMLEGGKRKKAIEFKEGYPVAVQSNLITECLGNMLVEQGKMTEKELDESIRLLKKSGSRQGEILVAMDILDEEAVSEALREQATSKLFEIFGWRQGDFSFRIGRTLRRGNALALDCSPASIVVEGARNHVPLRRIDRYIEQNRERSLALAENPFYRFQSVSLSMSDVQVITQLENGRTLGDHAGCPEGVRRTLFGLLKVKLLTLGPVAVEESHPASMSKPKARPKVKREAFGETTASEAGIKSELDAMAREMRSENYFEVLRLTTEADDMAVQGSYDAIVRRVHPDRFRNASGSLRHLAGELYELAGKAREALEDRQSRIRYVSNMNRGSRKLREQEKSKRALAAETAFQNAKEAQRSRDFEGALILYGKALECYPEEGEYCAHYGWCLHQCHPDNAVILQEAIEHVRRGVKLARDRETPYLFLGRLYKVAGRTDAAEKMFNRAVAVQPRCVEALREIRLINMRREKGKGVIRWLLRR